MGPAQCLTRMRLSGVTAAGHNGAMAVSSDFRDLVLDQLGALAPQVKRMFGGAGLFRDGLMFAVLDDDRLYFKVDAVSRPRFEAAGMGPFEYAEGKRALGYYEVPADVFEDSTQLVEWARTAIAVAIAKNAAKPKPRSKRATRK